MIHVCRKKFTMTQRPRQFWIFIERQIAVRFSRQFVSRKSIEPHEPIGLVKPMFANKRNGFERKTWIGMRNGAECRIENTPETVLFVQGGGFHQGVGVRRGRGSDNKLRALAGGREQRLSAAA